MLFGYKNSDGDVLKEVNLIFEGGKMTSLVGHGSGKSTILNLIQDFMIVNLVIYQ